jgi:hypothetical protein
MDMDSAFCSMASSSASPAAPGVDFMKPFGPKFTGKT